VRVRLPICAGRSAIALVLGKAGRARAACDGTAGASNSVESSCSVAIIGSIGGVVGRVQSQA
jgi:hypothetical protein